LILFSDNSFLTGGLYLLDFLDFGEEVIYELFVNELILRTSFKVGSEFEPLIQGDKIAFTLC
jgi:hypothetical protein